MGRFPAFLKTSFWKVVVKNFCISLLLGGVPTIIIYLTETTKTSIIKKVSYLFPDKTSQIYLLAGYSVFLLLSGFLASFWLRNNRAEGLLVFIKDVFKETASGLRNVIQAMVGSIVIFCLFWICIEPQTFKYSMLCFFLTVGCIFLVTSSILDKIENYLG